MNNVKENIMIRVWTIYLLRKWGIASAFVLLSLLCLILIDVPSVITNALAVTRASGSTLGFFTTAFSQNIFLIKSLVTLEFIIFLIMAKDWVTSLYYRRDILAS